jgi:protocatechuate 3,4-dioxygenase, alpha subunit
MTTTDRAPAAHPRLTATPSQTVGPFFHFACGTDPALGRLTVPRSEGEPIRLRLRVLDGDGAAVTDALVEIYQADASGHYPPDREPPSDGFSGFGRLATDANGTCVFETIRPGAVIDEEGRRQAPHVNICLFARGLLHHLFTRLYFDGDAGLTDDPVLACVPDDRRPTLVASVDPEDPTMWALDIHLQGEHETVFFEL